jgi:hypothetical protein
LPTAVVYLFVTAAPIALPGVVNATAHPFMITAPTTLPGFYFLDA